MIGCYIIYSILLDQYYIGITQNGITKRILMHNTSGYGKHFTSKANDWQLYFFIECFSMSQSMKKEKHIKSMKSRKYLENLKKYPEITHKLLEKYGS